MKTLPLFLNMDNKKVLVVGGGNASLIKIKKLIDFDCDITVISNHFLDDIIVLGSYLNIVNKNFEKEDLDNFFLVIAAADENTNKYVYKCAVKKGILCNVSSRNIRGDFIFPAHKNENKLTIAVSTNGSYPLISKSIVEKIGNEIDLSDLSKKIDFLEFNRKYIINNVENKILRKKIMSEFVSDNILYCTNYDEYIKKINNILKRYFDE